MDGKAFLFGWMLFINETKHLFGWMAKHFCSDGCCLLMKQRISLDGWQSVFVRMDVVY